MDMDSSTDKLSNGARRENTQPLLEWAKSKYTSHKSPGLMIINAALPRMGTKSMALAYQTLGFKVHHALLEETFDTPWSLLEEATEATWPGVHGAPSPPRPPYTRQDWDRLWGNDYDVVTDLAGPFVLELIKAYPEAKVVVIQRDFAPWWKSFKSQLFDAVTAQPRAAITKFVYWNVFGVRSVHAMSKLFFAVLGGRTREECEKNARRVYERYYEEVRKAVPESRRLEYRLGQGWGPLCKFLGADVPNTEFPRVNSTEEFRQDIKARFLRIWIGPAKAALRVAVGLVIVLLAVLVVR